VGVLGGGKIKWVFCLLLEDYSLDFAVLWFISESELKHCFDPMPAVNLTVLLF
jgi:hypothetical protein